MAPPTTYQNTLFVNLPVSDLPRSIAFYSSIGLIQNPAFTTPGAAMMSLPPNLEAADPHSGPLKVMLLTHTVYSEFLPEGVTIPEGGKTAEVMLTFSRDSAEGVEDFMKKAAENGGRRNVWGTTLMEKDMEPAGMVCGNAADPDGHILEVVYKPQNA